jgi:hypothetical protein
MFGREDHENFNKIEGDYWTFQDLLWMDVDIFCTENNTYGSGLNPM